MDEEPWRVRVVQSDLINDDWSTCLLQISIYKKKKKAKFVTMWPNTAESGESFK